jgi:amino acid transporter
VAIVSYGLAGTVVAVLGQAGTTVRGAYDVLVSMAIICYFLPYLFMFAAMIRLQRQPAGPEVRRVPGGKPVAIALASIGLVSTSLTIFLSVFPAEDEPHKVMAVIKIVGGTAIMIGIGFVLLLIARYKGRKLTERPAQLT